MVFSIAVSEIINKNAPVPLTGDVEEQIRYAASLGFGGVEIHTPSPEQVGADRIITLCRELGIAVTTIGTGSIFGKFNLSIAEYVKKHTRIPVFYYISPKIWAWRESRIKNIRRAISLGV